MCGESLLGDLTFTITDLEHKVVFDSKKNDYPDFWDFKVKNTQQFIVEVQVPQPEEKTSAATGCVSIIVGFKEVFCPEASVEVFIWPFCVNGEILGIHFFFTNVLHCAKLEMEVKVIKQTAIITLEKK